MSSVYIPVVLVEEQQNQKREWLNLHLLMFCTGAHQRAAHIEERPEKRSVAANEQPSKTRNC